MPVYGGMCGRLLYRVVRVLTLKKARLELPLRCLSVLGETDVQLKFNKAIEGYNDAMDVGVEIQAVILASVSFHALGKAEKEVESGFRPISARPSCRHLKAAFRRPQGTGVQCFQIDEPILVLGSAGNLEKEFATAYAELAPVARPRSSSPRTSTASTISSSLSPSSPLPASRTTPTVRLSGSTPPLTSSS